MIHAKLTVKALGLEDEYILDVYSFRGILQTYRYTSSTSKYGISRAIGMCVNELYKHNTKSSSNQNKMQLIVNEPKLTLDIDVVFKGIDKYNNQLELGLTEVEINSDYFLPSSMKHYSASVAHTIEVTVKGKLKYRHAETWLEEFAKFLFKKL